jgi:hypothetical protein
MLFGDNATASQYTVRERERARALTDRARLTQVAAYDGSSNSTRRRSVEQAPVAIVSYTVTINPAGGTASALAQARTLLQRGNASSSDVDLSATTVAVSTTQANPGGAPATTAGGTGGTLPSNTGTPGSSGNSSTLGLLQRSLAGGVDIGEAIGIS